jgi:hypothetical protein
MRLPSLAIALLPVASMTACGGGDSAAGLDELPDLAEYCLAAQRIVTRTEVPMQLVVHEDFDAFVKSKAIIEGPQIQQYNWTDEQGRVFGISCKLKSADHLRLTFGDDAAGPDGLCQDMNRAVFEEIAPRSPDLTPAYSEVVFEPQEAVWDDEEPGMTGPEWLAPYEATWVDEQGRLHIRAKGFQVDFTDPAFEQAPPRFRGIHYCHFLSPGYLAALMLGEAEPGVVIGRKPDTADNPGGH